MMVLLDEGGEQKAILDTTVKAAEAI
jgi:hypothetical protein